MSSIRAALVKGRNAGDPVYLAAEESTKSFKERIGQIHAMHTQSANGTGISPARVNHIGSRQIHLPCFLLVRHEMFPL